jgi:hypothetical protein
MIVHAWQLLLNVAALTRQCLPRCCVARSVVPRGACCCLSAPTSAPGGGWRRQPQGCVRGRCWDCLRQQQQQQQVNLTVKETAPPVLDTQEVSSTAVEGSSSQCT